MNINNMEEKMSMDLAPPPEHLCYVRCNFCNTVLALYSCERPSIRETISKYKVVIPYKRLMETVTVKCGHCGNVSFLSTRPPLQGQCLDRQITLQGYNFLEKPGGFCNSIDHHINKKVQPSSSSSSASTQPDSPRPFVVKPPEKKHRLPSAYNRFMKEEIQRIKAANPEIAHREAFSTAAKNWARFLPHSPAGSLAGSSKIN